MRSDPVAAVIFTVSTLAIGVAGGMLSVVLFPPGNFEGDVFIWIVPLVAVAWMVYRSPKRRANGQRRTIKG